MYMNEFTALYGCRDVTEGRSIPPMRSFIKRSRPHRREVGWGADTCDVGELVPPWRAQSKAKQSKALFVVHKNNLTLDSVCHCAPTIQLSIDPGGAAPSVFLFPKMASHDVISGDKLPNPRLPIWPHDAKFEITNSRLGPMIMD